MFAKLLKENLSNFNFDYTIILSDAILALDRLKNQQFDLIFLDPPYASALIEPALAKIKANDLLKPDGVIIANMILNVSLLEIAQNGGFNIFTQRNYGDTSITILQLSVNYQILLCVQVQILLRLLIFLFFLNHFLNQRLRNFQRIFALLTNQDLARILFLTFSFF
ncbi:MAG: RsmD family RNA methyltransferase [Sphingobacterium sp.]|nr:RsmD family RNA methyltransferase [Sphingobacterium sp.]